MVCIRLIAIGVLILTSARNGNPAAIPRETAPEYAVKAALIYNFVQYVTWPAEAFPSQDSPFVIGILGQDPFGDVIDKVVEGRGVMGRRIQVRRVTLAEAATGCHVVFISREEGSFLADWLRALRTKPVLSVTESPEEISASATILFVKQGNSLRYDVNLETAEEAGLKIATPMIVSARRILGRAPKGRDPP